jgi:predicted ABC-type ATPase
MSGQRQPTCWIIAGPNGAGKTTFALKYLPEVAGCRSFVNADLIAAGLSPLDPEHGLMAASRLFLREVEQYIQLRQTFAFETTLSGRGYLRLVRRLVRDAWQVELVYLALPSVEMSVLRVAERIAHGGHSVPLDAINRRFPRSLHNLLYVYSGAVSRTRCFLNIGDSPELVFQQTADERDVFQHEWFDQLSQQANR